MTSQALAECKSYNWPGNVREIASVIEMAGILSSGRNIGIEDLPIKATSLQQEEMKTLKVMEKEHISQALTSSAGNKTKAAKTLGISLRNLYRKIERYGLQGS